MNKIELNHWYVNENTLSISLMRFYVEIKILKNDYTLYYLLHVKGEENREMTFTFYTIEEALFFTEEFVAKSYSINEVFEKYISTFENKNFQRFHLSKKKK